MHSKGRKEVEVLVELIRVAPKIGYDDQYHLSV